jgi:palmitoyl-protein thioesterase
MTSIRALLVAVAAVLVGTAAVTGAAASTKLPVFFFHGVTGNKTNGAVIQANLTAEGRTYVALDFCQNACSVHTSLSTQVQMAIKQIRGIVKKDAATYAKGYHFIGHSTGGSLARGVIEEMDDHAVHSYISLAGDGNGNFYGPQASDAMPLQVLLTLLGPYAIDATDFNFSKYAADPTSWKGMFQRDFAELAISSAALQASNSIVNSFAPPLDTAALQEWIQVDPFYPQVNNLQACGVDAKCVAHQARRKANFLRLKAAHFFASPQDDLQCPWQTAVLSKYSTVASVEEIETKFSELTMVSVKGTNEYTHDLYGLRTLDAAGGLHFHEVPSVPQTAGCSTTRPS